MLVAVQKAFCGHCGVQLAAHKGEENPGLQEQVFAFVQTPTGYINI